MLITFPSALHASQSRWRGSRARVSRRGARDARISFSCSERFPRSSLFPPPLPRFVPLAVVASTFRPSFPSSSSFLPLLPVFFGSTERRSSPREREKGADRSIGPIAITIRGCLLALFSPLLPSVSYR